MCAPGHIKRRCKRSLKVQFGHVDVVEIQACNLGRIPDTSHDLAYGHNRDYLSLNGKAEALKAIKVAASRVWCQTKWHVC